MAESMNDSINGALDASYNKISKPMLSSITALSTSRTSAMQRALKELDDEAARLTEAEKRMMPDNPALLKSFSTYADLMITAKALIEASDNAIQDSGILLAPVSVTAKVFLPMAAEMMRRGVSPLSAQALKFYKEQIEGNGAKWTIPTTANYVRGYVDTKAWRDRLDGWAPGYADLTHDTIIKYIQGGAGPRSVASKMRQHAENIPRWAAENLTRTLQNTSYRDASVAMEAVNGGFIQYKIRIAALTPTTCLSCISLHGTRLEAGERVDDHYNGRCDLPGNLISGATPTAFVSRNYNGDAIVIHTASGKKLPVTPNHPILTDRGWVAAQFIKVGDNVISYGGADWASANVYPNKKHVPSIVQDIPRTFLLDRFGSMPISSKDFHGDGINGDIGIVWANGFLGNKIDSSFIQPDTKKPFGVIGRKSNQFSAFSNLATMFKRQGSATREFLRVFDVGFSDIFWRSFHPQLSSSGHTTALASGITQSGTNYRTGNPERFSNLVFTLTRSITGNNRINVNPLFVNNGLDEMDCLNLSTFGSCSKQPMSIEVITKSIIANVPDSSGFADICPGLISLDPVIEVSVTRFSGHVYSIQSNKGWYIDNGIIAHNCSDYYVLPGGGPPEFMQADSRPGQRNFVKFQTGADWFNSLPEERQKQQASFINTPAKWNAFKKGTPLSEFIGDHTDDVFGAQKIELSLKAALGDDADQYYTR